MMRMRMIKPGFFKNEQLAEAEPLTRILFAGLWGLADREGRLEDRPARIKAEVLPYDRCDVIKMLAWLGDHGFIRRYDVDGKQLICIPTFKEHQKCNQHEPPSTLAEPVGTDKHMQAHASTCMHVQGTDMHMHARASTCMENQPQPAPVLVPVLDPDLRNLNLKDLKEQDRSQDFEAFWKQYPRKDCKQDAQAAWKKLSDNERRLAFEDVPKRAAANWAGREREKLPHAATYLNQKRWIDDIQPRGSPGNTGRPETAIEMAKRRLREAEQEVSDGQSTSAPYHHDADSGIPKLAPQRRVPGPV
jgi:hypothetical protein